MRIPLSLQSSTRLRPKSEFAGARGGGQGRRLIEKHLFGSNPGKLAMFYYAPAGLRMRAPLVVVLHGCTQTASGYASGAGWNDLADRLGFALLAPEQSAANNMNRCFNWFEPGDTSQDQGEVASIRQMIDVMIAEFDSDPELVFITGLSAGGAMANAMLASYPEIFNAGAIIAGLPYGAASELSKAWTAMNRPSALTARDRGNIVRQASQSTDRWPRISVWHGSADFTVAPSNSEAIVDQWCDVHGLSRESYVVTERNGNPHRVWRDADNRPVIEAYNIVGMGHGTPILEGASTEACGSVGPFIISTSISSSHEIAKFWGLVGTPWSEEFPASQPVAKPVNKPHRLLAPNPVRGFDVQKAIADALRAAGLLK